VYILFPQEIPQNIKTSSVGCSEYIPEFHYGVYFEDMSQLKKIEEVTIEKQEKNENNELLYIDKNGIISTNKILGKPLIKKSTQSNVIDFLSYPEKFTLEDIMLCKKQYFLNRGYDECYIYEFNIFNFIDLENSTNYDAGINNIKLKKNSVLDVKPLKFDYSLLEVKIHSLYPISVHYGFENKNFKKGNSINLKNKVLYLKFKNTVDKDNILYDYQLLLRK